jgi:ankyrin repeat protein
VDIKDTTTGETPLLTACRVGALDIVKLCLKAGAEFEPNVLTGGCLCRCRRGKQAIVCAGNASA